MVIYTSQSEGSGKWYSLGVHARQQRDVQVYSNVGTRPAPLTATTAAPRYVNVAVQPLHRYMLGESKRLIASHYSSVHIYSAAGSPLSHSQTAGFFCCVNWQAVI